METCFQEQVLNLYNENRWRDILELNKNSDNQTARKLLWVWPTESNLVFIKKTIFEFNLKGVISIGCGCGLLEWILQQATELPVIGYEANEEWWKSRYSDPQFIQLQFPEFPLTQKILNPNFALLFCYFNNGEAFKQYLDCYDGELIFIIGPGEGAGRHTNPEPFKPEFNKQNEWQLFKFEEVKDTKDYIAVYTKQKHSIKIIY